MQLRKRVVSLAFSLMLIIPMLLSTVPAFAAPIPNGAPAMPSNVIYSPITEDSVTITWDAVPDAQGYNIYRREAKATTTDLIGSVTSIGWIDTTVVLGHDYWYSVSAYNAAGEGQASKEAFIMLANDDAIELIRFNVSDVAGPGSRIRLGDLDGDGRTDILICNTSKQSNNTLITSAIYLLSAYTIEGELLWQYTIDPGGIEAAMGGSGIDRSSQDEPVQIADVDGDGYNEVIAVMNPEKDRQNRYYGNVFVVLDGKTGEIKKDAAGNECRIPIVDLNVPGLSKNNLTTTSGASSNINSLGDCITFANLDGRLNQQGESYRSHVLLKGRYDNITAFEVFNQDGKFAMDYVFRQATRYAGQNQTIAGHMPLSYDLNGDGTDNIISNYTVFRTKTDENGKVVRHPANHPDSPNQPVIEPWWWIKSNVEMRSGMAGDPLNDSTPAYYTDTTMQIKTSDHCDTIQVGYVFGQDGPLCIVFGGAGPDGASAGDLYRSSSFCYTFDGVFQWVSNTALEPQSLNLAQFRTDADGLITYGLDRRNRGNYPNGQDGMFLIGTHGEALFVEDSNPMGWSSIVIRVDNWTGTYAPLCMSFFRNDQSAIAARAGNYPTPGTGVEASKQAWKRDYRAPALYDGYTNTLFEMAFTEQDKDSLLAGNGDWRFMAMDLCADARTELVGYNDLGDIFIFYNNANGEVRENADGTLNQADKLAVLRSGITGEPKPQTQFMSNYSRYPTDVYFDHIEDRIPARPVVREASPTSAYIDWTPIVNADSYTLYRDGEKIGEFTEVGYWDKNLNPNTTYSYTVVASNAQGTSQESLPLEVTTGKSGISISGDLGVVQGEDAKYYVSVSNIEKLATVTLWVEVEDAFLSSKAFTGLNDFELLDNVKWTRSGDKWVGRATLINLKGGVSVSYQDKLDLLEMVFKAKDTFGTTEVKVTRVELSGYDANNQAIFLSPEIAVGTANTIVGEYFSPYDLNRDGKVDQLDLTLAQLYYGAREGDSNWDTAKIADVNGDGRVDIEDLILILNNIVW